MEDFVEYLTKVCFKPKKVAKELAASIRRVWLQVDKDMIIQPNALASPEKLEDSKPDKVETCQVSLVLSLISG